MKDWVFEQLGRTIRDSAGVVVILDPEQALDTSDVADLSTDVDLICVSSWVDLRRTWDTNVRLIDDSRRLAVLVTDPQIPFAENLPWDIEHETDVVIRVRWPAPKELTPLLKVARERVDALVAASRRHPQREAAIAAAYGFRVGDATSELDAIAQLRLDPGTSQSLWDALAGAFATPIARQIADNQGDLMSLQRAWDEWLMNGNSAPHAEALRAAPSPILRLLGSGLLTPAPVAATGLPNWVSVGATAPDPMDVINELLATQPSPASTISEWISVASWWGKLRGTLAANPTLKTSAEMAWARWDKIDTDFSAWLRASYGTTLLSSATTPRSVHQIASFLSRRVDDGARVLLIVIDGLAFAQWDQLRIASGLVVIESSGCLAMVPTLTSISRQAIFAGSLPSEFADTIGTTTAEPRRWKEFWNEHGVNERDVSFSKTVGRGSSDVPALTHRVEAVVVNAVDELLHAADVLGDPQLASSVDLWARTGFLRELVATATAHGYETWITADHGNLPTVPSPVPKEGQTVESAGTRVRMYPNATLRSAAAGYGDSWDPPILPTSWLKPLFASRRNGFHTSGIRVSHGGLSLDEVIVPFARVTA